MLAAIFSFLGTILNFFSNIMGGSYLLGLFIFALLIKIILLPFGIKQQKNSIRQAKMKPKEEAIRKKYKGRDDRVTQQKMQSELTDMYQNEGYNPASGCLPMLLQMVIILLLYQVIINPLQYVVGMDGGAITALNSFITTAKDAGGYGFAEAINANRYGGITILKVMLENGSDALRGGFIADFQSFLETTVNAEGALVYTAENVTTYVASLTEAYAKGLPTFDFFGMQNFLAEIPNIKTFFTAFSWEQVLLMLVPLTNFGATYLTTKLTKKLTYQPQMQQQNGCSAVALDWFAPVMTLWIAFVVPAAIGMYWLFNNLLGVIQQLILHKAFPLPKFTEEDYKAAEREIAGKTPKNRPSYASVASERSLYLEDFDDDDDKDVPASKDDDDDDSAESRPSTPIAPAKLKDSGSDKKKDNN